MKVKVDADRVRYLEAELSDHVGLLSDGEIEVCIEHKDMLNVTVAKSLEVGLRGVKLESKLVDCVFKMGLDSLEFIVVAGDDGDIVSLYYYSGVRASGRVFDVLYYTTHQAGPNSVAGCRAFGVACQVINFNQ